MCFTTVTSAPASAASPTEGILLAGSLISEHMARPCGATVPCLTPDQKVSCSNHVGVRGFSMFLSKNKIVSMNLVIVIPLTVTDRGVKNSQWELVDYICLNVALGHYVYQSI